MANKRNKNRSVVGRNDAEFLKEIKELAAERYLKKLEKKVLSPKEMQRLMRRTPSWEGVKNELKTRQNKDNLL